MSKNEKMSNKTKTTRTYSIDNDLYNEFSEIIETKMFNRSKIIESLIKNWVDNNKINK